LHQEIGIGRRLHDEGEGAVAIGGDGDGNRHPRLQALRLRVERLAELHDVEAALTERGADRRRGIRLAGRDLQLDETDDFLCHSSSLSSGARSRLWLASRTMFPPAASLLHQIPPPAQSSSI